MRYFYTFAFNDGFQEIPSTIMETYGLDGMSFEDRKDVQFEI